VGRICGKISQYVGTGEWGEFWNCGDRTWGEFGTVAIALGRILEVVAIALGRILEVVAIALKEVSEIICVSVEMFLCLYKMSVCRECGKSAIYAQGDMSKMPRCWYAYTR